MYSRAIKFSIPLLVAAIVSAACFSSTAEAASYSPQFRLSQITVRGVVVASGENDTLYDSTDQTAIFGNEYLTYCFTVQPEILFAAGSYTSGYSRADVLFNVSTISPNGWVMYGFNMEFLPHNEEGFYNYVNTSSNNYAPGYCTITSVFDNAFGSGTYVSMGNLKIYVTFRKNDLSAADPTAIDMTFSISYVSGNTQSSAEPVIDRGFSEVIKDSILAALEQDIYGEDPDKFSISDMLTIYSQYLYAIDVRQEYIDNNIQTLVSDLVTVISKQDTAISKLNNLLTAISDLQSNYLTMSTDWILPSLNGINNKLQQLIDMGATETEGASEAQDAINQLGSQVDVLDQPTIAINDIFDPVDGAASDHGSDAANIFWWTWDSRITSIMYMVMAFGIIGFVIYGKSG